MVRYRGAKSMNFLSTNLSIFDEFAFELHVRIEDGDANLASKRFLTISLSGFLNDQFPVLF